jgi:hypothetical protein
MLFCGYLFTKKANNDPNKADNSTNECKKLPHYYCSTAKSISAKKSIKMMNKGKNKANIAQCCNF